ncbi:MULTISPECIES: DUF1826 domain-containing protein [Spongiibacter]|uniref:DUF1826 domain-containing protein n=1 Tax=Spongiibacter TaxID=630749 RepID=UPI000C525DCA|nr:MULTISPECIES: DUF1826 domain-containing protein [Spongiibacter]MAY38198.1 succinylglutamate desuccinylase [Spongiibacter sp.]|tara:strand:+ start:38787 stop:39455 length:669 start_codon:yes stop_codon:yes gene_type:complete
MIAAQHTSPATTAAASFRHDVLGHSPERLTEIYQDDVNMAVWRRQQSPPLLQEDARALLRAGGLSDHRVVLRAASDVDRALPGIAAYPHLAADLRLLTEMFCCLFDLRSGGLRMNALRSEMCPKFHIDHVPCRLICTYTGPATEWLPHEVVDRRRLDAGSQGLSDADSGLYPSPAAICQLAAGDVALLKGEQWAGNEGAGLVHRSPCVPDGETRLLLTLDFA